MPKRAEEPGPTVDEPLQPPTVAGGDFEAAIPETQDVDPKRARIGEEGLALVPRQDVPPQSQALVVREPAFDLTATPVSEDDPMWAQLRGFENVIAKEEQGRRLRNVLAAIHDAITMLDTARKYDRNQTINSFESRALPFLANLMERGERLDIPGPLTDDLVQFLMREASTNPQLETNPVFERLKNLISASQADLPETMKRMQAERDKFQAQLRAEERANYAAMERELFAERAKNQELLREAGKVQILQQELNEAKTHLAAGTQSFMNVVQERDRQHSEKVKIEAELAAKETEIIKLTAEKESIAEKATANVTTATAETIANLTAGAEVKKAETLDKTTEAIEKAKTERARLENKLATLTQNQNFLLQANQLEELKQQVKRDTSSSSQQLQQPSMAELIMRGMMMSGSGLGGFPPRGKGGYDGTFVQPHTKASAHVVGEKRKDHDEDLGGDKFFAKKAKKKPPKKKAIKALFGEDVDKKLKNKKRKTGIGKK